jgi:hypothetical protein
VVGAVAGPGCGPPGDDRPADWDYIAPAIIAPNCATSSCHSPTAAVSGLDLSTAERAYKSLLQLELPNRDGATGARPLVTPNNPAESRIIRMIRAQGADRMPPDRPLAEADIVLIEKWILAGARK